MSSIEYINSVVLTANASEITFSNIPQNYQDLTIVTSADTDYTFASTQSIFIRLNGDSASNYSATWLLGNGSAASSSRNSNNSSGIYIGEVSATLNYVTPLTVNIFSYSNTNTFKTAISDSSVASAWITTQVGLWRSATAISSVSLYASGYNFTAGTNATLWGVK